MPSTWHGVSSLLPVSERFAYRKIPERTKPPEGSRAADRWGPKLFTEKNLAIVESLIEFAETRNHTILELAFAWLLSYKPVASVIAGASNPEQVRANTKAANWQLTSNDLARIDAIMNRG